MIRIAIDCMGGDFGLPVTVPSALDFASRFADVHLLLVGQPDAVSAALAADARSRVLADRVEVVPATEVVAMDDPVEVALRRKKDSSMRVAAQAVKDGRADACVSAGNTGAWMAITRYVLKTLDGIDRPAIATSIPNQLGGATIMLDLGANVDCSAEHLLQFGIMGAALAQGRDASARPSVGLLNIGEEIIKGNDVVKHAAVLLRDSPLNFYGNVEGNDIFKGTVDVVVCDGFVGNAVLKAMEGIAKMLGSMIREEFQRNAYSMMSGMIAKPVLNRFKDRMDHRHYNGAALLGLRGVVIKSHGSADSYAFGFALQRARDAVAKGVLERTASYIAQMTQQGGESLETPT
ncbi:phosphate acyltransferase PlsX [Kerstersia gyiorum]|uniref:Phosphate acyltransferase n=1 Tax=Kerstersia gyiorum TaxID=206506 RepID=A0A4Q7MZX3_9BURK|nr:phosphate acyltransferase PlsX [Kerstersia gyiorum]AZV94656.1 phosphate acyltransferase [Bordetella sp. J329]KAB0541934.1 phosphate acyltransferase PlsX [Kerstersia gyiorum]MCH4271688.1 phosphate acyltransferase PlsX [Kerstersia gyiorum]MCI1228717.1 phosphate acyltransferase PlsX [Kerstersia gyiorum]MCP1632496.1 glycerol-3-phosphate acyltransferase PlsX [Kerstersia gyiorum]